MKNLILILFISLIFISCNKDESKAMKSTAEELTEDCDDAEKAANMIKPQEEVIDLSKKPDEGCTL